MARATWPRTPVTWKGLDVTEAAILDTGPLVAFLHANEQHHGWVVDRLRELPPRFLTCEAVLTESCLLLGFDSRAVEQIGPLTFCPASPAAAGGLLRR